MRKVLKLEDNYLSFNIRTLTILGMWDPRRGNDGDSLLYTYYAFGLFCLAGMTQTIAEVLHALKNRNNMVVFTQHFTIVTGMTSTMIKIVNLWRRRIDIEELIDLLNYERRQPCNRKFAIYREKIVTSTVRICTMLSLSFIIMVLLYGVVNYGKILVYHKENLDMLPLSPLIPSRSSNPFFYWFLFIYDEVTFFYVAGCVACHDSLFMVFLIHLSTQLDLLKVRLKFCHDNIDNIHEEDRIEKDGNFNDLKVECVCRTNLQELLTEPITELRACIDHHHRILRYVSLVQNIFNHTLLLQFVSSLVMITMIGFQLIGGHKLESNELIQHTILLLCALFQLFLYCWFGTDIIAKSESISLSAYQSKWYIADKRFKTTLKILLCKGQIPIKIRVGYICELSSVTFMNIIGKCYSSMALLQRVNEPK